jgi:hypothetical protein
MTLRRIRRPSPALVVACLALLVGLAGTGYAAVQLPRNSVGTAQLKNNAVTSIKVRNHSLRLIDFKAGQVPAGPAGPAGAAGPAGPKGDTGAKGDPGISGLVRVSGTLATGPGNHLGVTAVCPSGKKALSGGFSTAAAPADLRITTDVVLSDGVTYRVDGQSSTASSWNLAAFVVCANVS